MDKRLETQVTVQLELVDLMRLPWSTNPGENDQIKVWDTESEKPRQSFEGTKGDFGGAFLSPDGKWLALANEKTA